MKIPNCNVVKNVVGLKGLTATILLLFTSISHASDSDGDGVPNEYDSHPGDPSLYFDYNRNGINDDEEDLPYVDSDQDGVPNIDDSHPYNPNLTHDGNNDGWNDNGNGPYDIFGDLDGDGAINYTDTHPFNPLLFNDIDYDGLEYTFEMDIGTNPIVADSDGDSLLDGFEYLTLHTDPLNPDTDYDGVNDGNEVANGTDPLDPLDF